VPVALERLGQLYLSERGVPRDDKKAAELITEAAERGLASAQNTYGLLYMAGIGVAHDLDTAAHWFKLAADQGDMVAQDNLKNCRGWLPACAR